MLSKRNPSEHLDEMQVHIRNNVGNQSFFILFYALMINFLLKDYGIQWAASPISFFIIMMLTMGYYLVRIVWAGAVIIVVSTAISNRKSHHGDD